MAVGFQIQVQGPGLRFRIEELGLRIPGLTLRIYDSELWASADALRLVRQICIVCVVLSAKACVTNNIISAISLLDTTSLASQYVFSAIQHKDTHYRKSIDGASTIRRKLFLRIP